MQDVQTPLWARNDTFFGVCQGLGEDLGISSNLLRLAFALALFFNPLATIVGYAAAGALVFASRRLFPRPVAAAPEPELAEAEAKAMPLAA